MASSAPSSSGPPPVAPPPRSSAAATVDPVLRNTLRYTISAREYAVLHKYILSRSRVLRRNAPGPAAVDKALAPARGGDDDNAKAVRHALRVFTATWLGAKGWDVVARRVGGKE
ncbi:hypothetical protein G6O67_008026 [Ophiocordyceps sinensis]|uniref:Uncharacterized protein n=1 Tax=Ophiocordyceps sinensis TaxID=72228 RepID=A0A8H4PJK8_9HYPO|nr:hypothetical protein G6O67_008026 [Ophiocordyceps sinensis]